MVLGDHFVARAVVAQRIAKRNVHVQRKRLGPRALVVKALGQRALVLLVAKGLDKAVRRGVGGVARAGHIKLLEQTK